MPWVEVVRCLSCGGKLTLVEDDDGEWRKLPVFLSPEFIRGEGVNGCHHCGGQVEFQFAEILGSTD